MKTVVLFIVIAISVPRGDAITSGTVVKINNHPYQVAIDFHSFPSPDDDDPAHTSFRTTSGALLTQKTIITSCSSLIDEKGSLNISQVVVRVGAQRRDAGGASFKVVDYLLHPDYRYDTWSVDGDVLLLYLDEEVPLRSDSRPVPLADPSKTSLAPGEKLVLTGYGNNTAGEVLEAGQVRELQAAALPFVNQAVCEDVWGFYMLSTVRACAGGLAEGACGEGDNGAPVVNWRGELVGVASPEPTSLSQCGVLGQPTVFTSLLTTDMRQWIVSNADGKQPSTTDATQN